MFDGVPYGGYYTQEQAREIVEYARQRYITVIPEFDIPGHTKAALACYPELGCTGGPYQVARSWGVFQDVLCLGKEKTFTFVQDVLDEIMDIFPSKVIHIGGDESPTVAWEQCPLCQKKMKEEGVDAKHFQGYFTNRIEKYLNSKGHSIMGWDEILEGKISTTATIMSWRGAEPGIQAALKGHDVVMTPNTHNYFDYYQADDKEEKKLGLIGGCLQLKTFTTIIQLQVYCQIALESIFLVCKQTSGPSILQAKILQNIRYFHVWRLSQRYNGQLNQRTLKVLKNA